MHLPICCIVQNALERFQRMDEYVLSGYTKLVPQPMTSMMLKEHGSIVVRPYVGNGVQTHVATFNNFDEAGLIALV